MPSFYPLLRRFFSPVDYDPNNPYAGSACTYSPYEIVKCGPNDEKILFVEPQDPCCCKVPCSAYPTTLATPCKCFVGVQDLTGQECDIQYAIQVSGPLVPPGCDGVHELVEGPAGEPPGADCMYNFSCAMPDIACTINPENATNFPDCNNATPQVVHLTLYGQIYCATDPCGDAGFRCAISAATYDPYPCGTETLCGKPKHCNPSGAFVAWIATDTCGCMKPGEYKAYCYSFPPTFSNCVSTDNTGFCSDPYGKGALHTVTITKLSADDCKPCDCATPPCNDGGPTDSCGYGEI